MSGSSDNDTCISTIALQTAVGRNCAQTVAAIDAEISGFFDYPNYYPIARDKRGEEPYHLAAAWCNYIDPDVGGRNRLYQLLKQPVMDVIEQSKLKRAQMATTALWFALPEADSAVNGLNLEQGFLDEIIRKLVLPPFKDITATQTGACGIYRLIQNAKNVLAAGAVEQVIIVGVDSFFIEGRMAHYDRLWRLKSERNPFGFIAGEAGVAMMVEKVGTSKQRNVTPLLAVDSVGKGQEKQLISGDKNSSGEGLTAALDEVIQNSKSPLETPISWVISDLNGETYRAYEWSLAQVRRNKLFSDDLTLNHFSDVVGELGAATAGVQLACVAQAFTEQTADDKALLFACSDSGWRSTMLVSAIKV